MSFRARYGRRVAQDSSTAAALTVTLDCEDGGSLVEIYMLSSVNATFSIQASLDGAAWFETESVSAIGGMPENRAGPNTYRHLRVVCADANDNEIVISAGAA